MRNLLAGPALFLVTVALMAALPPDPKPPRPPALALVAQGTALCAKFTVSATGGPDSLIVHITATGTADRRWVYKGLASKTDSLCTIPRPAAGTTAQAAVWAYAAKFNKLSVSSDTARANYIEPIPEPEPPPPPVVEGLELKPTSVTLSPGGKLTYCAVQRWSDGRRTLVPDSDTIPGCWQYRSA